MPTKKGGAVTIISTTAPAKAGVKGKRRGKGKQGAVIVKLVPLTRKPQS